MSKPGWRTRRLLSCLCTRAMPLACTTARTSGAPKTHPHSLTSASPSTLLYPCSRSPFPCLSPRSNRHKQHTLAAQILRSYNTMSAAVRRLTLLQPRTCLSPLAATASSTAMRAMATMPTPKFFDYATVKKVSRGGEGWKEGGRDETLVSCLHLRVISQESLSQ